MFWTILGYPTELVVLKLMDQMISHLDAVIIFCEMVTDADDTTLHCDIDSGLTSGPMIIEELKKY